MISSIYNGPIFFEKIVFSITKNNELIVANAESLQIVDRIKLNHEVQLWVDLWGNGPVVRHSYEVYDLPSSTGLMSPIWKGVSGDVLLVSDNKIVSVNPTSWSNPVLDINCHDDRSGELLWSLKDERFSSVSYLSGVLLAKGQAGEKQALINLSNGSIEWVFQSPKSGGELKLSFVHENSIFFSVVQFGVQECGLCKIDRESGEVIWEVMVPEIGYKYDQVRNNFICFGNGRLTIIDAESGSVLVDAHEAADLGSSPRQRSFKVALNPDAGKLVFDVSSENSVIGVYDYVNQHMNWLSPFAEKGTIRVGRLWFSGNLIHIFDSTSTLRVGRDEGDHLQML